MQQNKYSYKTNNNAIILSYSFTQLIYLDKLGHSSNDVFCRKKKKRLKCATYGLKIEQIFTM